MMTENQISKIVLDICFQVHKHFGPGLYESVDESILCYELGKQGLKFDRQVEIPVEYDGQTFGNAFKADVVVEDKVILELKSIEKVGNVHRKQVLTYLKLTGMKLGLLINFNESLMKHGIVRVVNNLEE